MEGMEGPLSRPVHVLRHRFEATERLTEQVLRLLERQEREEKLRFFATRLAVLDGANYYNFRYDEIVGKVGDSFERHTTPIGLNGKVNLRSVQNNRVRIGFQPAKQIEFNTLLSGFDLLDDLRPDGRPLDHYIYTDVPKDALLRSDIERGVALNGFKKAVSFVPTRKLYTLQPLEVTGYDHAIPFRAEDEAIAKIARRKESWEEGQDIAS
ncbi:MAG: hypothetical protein JWM52_344 [Candidatus Saccharibacteria bacterium]|nr:hypothetical protein [Candidatus Saccharibacteria bacterium]